MKIIYPRTLILLLCGWLVACGCVYGQPAGGYGIQAVKYAVPSGAYFASATGTGGTPCSQSHPCSLSKALSSAPSGTTIVLRGGTYRTSDYDAKIPRKLILQPYPGETVILKGSKVATNWAADGGDWKTSWSKVFGAKYVRTKAQTVTSENPMAAHQDMVFVNGSQLRQVSSRSSVVAGSFYVDYANKVIYIGTDPSGKTVEVTASTWGLHTYGVSASGITVRGLKFTHYAECGMMLQSPDAVIENNEFTENAIAGMKIYSALRASIKNNSFSKNGLQGAGINQADELLFENNIVEKNNSEKHNRISWSAAGIKVLGSASCMIRNNLFRNNDANGIWLDDYAHKTFVINNRVEHEARNGIHCEISNGAVIAANVVTGCGYNPESHGSGIEVLNSADVRVYNNTVVNNLINMTVADAERSADLIQNETGARNVIVKNNILSDATVSDYPSCQLWVKRRNCHEAVVKELDHNGYHKSSLTQPALLVRWKVTSTCGDEEKIESLAELRDKLQHGHNSIALSGADPFFVDRSAADFRLKSGSPAIKAGTALPADVLAALGWSATAGVDMGAFQSSTSSPSAPGAPTAGNLPWLEDFNSSSYKGSLLTGQLYKNGIFKVESGKLVARGVGQAAFQSELIKLNGTTVNISLQASSKGSLETATDHIKLYYKLDGGAERWAGEVKGSLSSMKTIALSGVKGNTLQLVIRIRNSDITEHYFIDNIKVEAASAPSSPTAGNLPWLEDFNSSSYKGSLLTGQLYKNGIFKVESGKLVARGVGQAAFQSELIKLNGTTVNISLQASSKGSLESGSDHVRLYYKLDGGAERWAGEVKGSLSSMKTIALSGVKGNTLQLVIRISNSDITEHYFIDNIKVEAAGSSARIADAKQQSASEEITAEEETSAELAEAIHEVEVYPNPVATTLQVQVNDLAAGQVSLILLDINGSQLHQQQAQAHEAVSMDLSALQTGVYLLQIIDEQGNRQTERIIKE